MLLTVSVYLLFALLGCIAYYRIKNARMLELAAKFPGPKCLPFLGNALEFGSTSADFLVNLVRICAEWGPNRRVWIGPTLFIIITHPKDIEIVLGSTNVLEKAKDYKFIRPWLGNGLLTSAVPKWRKHRKILTPTFHFKILEQFVDVFNANSKILVEKLKCEVNGPTFDIYKYITLSALDNICESAMGVSVNAQINSDSEYVKAVRVMSEIVITRSFKVWQRNDWIFSFTKAGKLHDKYLKILHDTTNQVIKQRSLEIVRSNKANASSEDNAQHKNNEKEESFLKKRLAFLDLLLDASMNEDSNMTQEDIREEVDTFMFEGHDTTASGISFTLWLLSQHQDVQERVFTELQEILSDVTGPVKFQDLQAMKYLERVIKEALRLYPSVPMYARDIQEELALHNGLIVPKGATVTIFAYVAHLNPEIFPDPEKFDPDRFLPENAQGRHPYAYVPFSAGSRNCIGQKFAMMELKSTIAHVLGHYKLLPCEGKDLLLAVELILKSKTGICVKMIPREKIIY